MIQDIPTYLLYFSKYITSYITTVRIFLFPHNIYGSVILSKLPRTTKLITAHLKFTIYQLESIIPLIIITIQL